jgi:hypothetical protein
MLRYGVVVRSESSPTAIVVLQVSRISSCRGNLYSRCELTVFQPTNLNQQHLITSAASTAISHDQVRRCSVERQTSPVPGLLAVARQEGESGGGGAPGPWKQQAPSSSTGAMIRAKMTLCDIIGH